MPVGDHYTVDEWREIADSVSFDGVDEEQLMRLHRHWIWANYATREFDQANVSEGWQDVNDWTARVPWAMFLWYGLLHVVLEGYTARRIRYRGELAKDVRTTRVALQDARHAVFHVDKDFAYYDDRFTAIVSKDAAQLRRVHQALGQLLLDELARRRATPES